MNGTQIIVGVLAVVVLALLVVACGSDETPAQPVGTTAPPTPTSSATSSEAATPAATETPSTPQPTPEKSGSADARDAFFALDRVLDITIEIDPEDWDTLRHQTRTFEDLMAEIEKYELSQPFADIYDWFSGTVTIDGETHKEVGVRKKGFIGSQSDTKPSLKLRFDKYVDEQALGGVMERITLNNSIQDPSMVNTCLALQVFASAGVPSPRCNFATISVNGKDLGLYVHVEEIKKPFLSRYFDSAEGNLYEGTVSDFTPEYRGTFEKKTNEDEDNWSDIDTVMAAVRDPSDAGLKALSEIVDLDRFLSFWATEVLVGHWDGYTGDRNNYQFYREPDGRFVFIPWGVDDTLHLKDDPNPFDNISDPPPSVLALTAIPNRLYNDPDWRRKYVSRLKELLDTVWHEDELLASVDAIAAIVREHALPEARPKAAADTERVRQFIKKRKGEILADITPTPPEWPDPDNTAPSLELVGGKVQVLFETSWGSNKSLNPLDEGKATYLPLDETGEPVEDLAALAGHASPEERGILPRVGDLASLAIFGLDPSGTVNGMTLVLPLNRLTAGATLVIGEGRIAGGVWSLPPGAPAPTSYIPFTSGTLELTDAGTKDGAAISGSFSGIFGSFPSASEGNESSGDVGTSDAGSAKSGLVINEVAAKGVPLDWFELYNASESHIALANFAVADDLDNASKRVGFPSELVIAPGAYMLIGLEQETWPGFALGGDEELGIWTADGALVDSVDWAEEDAGEGMSYARVPDRTGEFHTVSQPTPGQANEHVH